MRSECKRLVEAGGGPFILACQGAANRELTKRVGEKYSILIRGPIRIMRGLIPLRCFIVLLKHRFVGSCTFHLCRGDNIGTECKERARDDSFTADRHGRLWTLYLLSSWVGSMHRPLHLLFPLRPDASGQKGRKVPELAHLPGWETIRRYIWRSFPKCASTALPSSCP